MTRIIEKFKQVIQELEPFQSDPALQKDKTEFTLLRDLLNQLTLAVKDKQEDWQISATTINHLIACCIPFGNAQLNTSVLNDLKPFCQTTMKARKKLIHSALDFVHDCQAIRNTSHLNLNAYQPEVFVLLQYLFKQENLADFFRKTSFEEIFTAFKNSNLITDTDIRTWLRSDMHQIEEFLQSLIISDKAVQPPHFEAGHYHFKPSAITLARLQARQRYGRFADSAPCSPTGSMPTAVPERLTKSLPNSPKNGGSATLPPADSAVATCSIMTAPILHQQQNYPAIPLLDLTTINTITADPTLYLKKGKKRK